MVHRALALLSGAGESPFRSGYMCPEHLSHSSALPPLLFSLIFLLPSSHLSSFLPLSPSGLWSELDGVSGA